MLDKFVRKIKRIPKITKCPHCGQKTVSFFYRVRACNRMYLPKCDKCNATIIMNRRYFVYKWLFIAAAFIAFLIINGTTELFRYVWFRNVPLFSLILAELSGAVFARVDYEATSSHPKPSPLRGKKR